jgi:hypothetical protein
VREAFTLQTGSVASCAKLAVGVAFLDFEGYFTIIFQRKKLGLSAEEGAGSSLTIGA